MSYLIIHLKYPLELDFYQFSYKIDRPYKIYNQIYMALKQDTISTNLYTDITYLIGISVQSCCTIVDFS